MGQHEMTLYLQQLMPIIEIITRRNTIFLFIAEGTKKLK